jgi:DNA repair protein RecO (recombination protein O)
MVVNTSGIVFHHLKYSESSIIAKIYTERFGLQSFLVKGVRQKNSRMRMNLFGPLSLVDLVMVYKEKSALHQLRDISNAYPFTGITTDISRTSLAIFINELLYKSIQGEEPDPSLFAWIVDTVKYLDSTTDRLGSFHLCAAMELTHFLGFRPHDNYSSISRFFDLQEGAFTATLPPHPYVLDETLSVYWHQLLAQPLFQPMPDDWSTSIRNLLLNKILDYYRLHLPNFREMKSHEVLKEVLH